MEVDVEIKIVWVARTRYYQGVSDHYIELRSGNVMTAANSNPSDAGQRDRLDCTMICCRNLAQPASRVGCCCVPSANFGEADYLAEQS